MQRSTTITIAGIGLTITEIPVNRLYSLLIGEGSIIQLPVVEAAEKVKELIPLAISSEHLDALLSADLYYDDLLQIFDTFQETNPAFFELARVAGLKDALADLIKTLLQSYCSRFRTSLNMVTAIMSGNGDTDSSSI